jgi:hypothetical protein
MSLIQDLVDGQNTTFDHTTFEAPKPASIIPGALAPRAEPPQCGAAFGGTTAASAALALLHGIQGRPSVHTHTHMHTHTIHKYPKQLVLS